MRHQKALPSRPDVTLSALRLRGVTVLSPLLHRLRLFQRRLLQIAFGRWAPMTMNAELAAYSLFEPFD